MKRILKNFVTIKKFVYFEASVKDQIRVDESMEKLLNMVIKNNQLQEVAISE